MRIATTGLGSIILIALFAGCMGPPDAEAPNTLVVDFQASRDYTVNLLRFAGGPNREVALSGSRFRQAGGRYVSDSTTIPARGEWPTTMALISPAGDTLATASPTLTLEPGRIVTLSVFALPNLVGWFICAPIVAQVPIGGRPAPLDTLYVVSLALRAGERSPVC